MKTVVIFHDAYARPTDDWLPWIKTQLEAQGFRVATPGLPQPPAATLTSWETEWASFGIPLDAETIVVGHGLGAVFALRELEKSGAVLGTILVAPFAQAPDHAALAKASETFLNTPFNWDAIRSHMGTATIFAGNDDPFVSVERVQEVANNLQVMPQNILDAGHFTRGTGYATFVQLIDAIMRIALPAPAVPDPLPATPIVAPIVPTPTLTETPTEVPPAPLQGVATMETETARVLSTSEGAVVQAALAGAREAELLKKKQAPTNPKNLIRIIGGLLLLGLGGVIFVIGAAKLIPQGLAPTQDQGAAANGFLKVESAARVDVSNIDSATLRSKLAGVRNETPENRSMLVIFSDGDREVSLASLVARLSGSELPIEAQGFLDGPVRLAIIHLQKEEPVFVLMTRVRSYDGAFTALSAWEPTLPQDVAALIPFPNIDPNARGLAPWSNILVRNIPLRITTGPAEIPAPIPEQTEIAPSAPTTDTTNEEISDEPEGADLIQTIINATESITPDQELAPEEQSIEPSTKLLYFFLNPETLAITTTPDIVPELIRRFSDR